MTSSKPRSPLALWPALRVTLYEFFSPPSVFNMMAAAMIPVGLLHPSWEIEEYLYFGDRHFAAPQTSHSAGLKHARESEIRLCHLIEEVLLKSNQRDDGDAIRERLEQVAARLHFYIIGSTIVPVELQVPQEVTSLPEAPLAALQKAINRYRAGDLDGAMTAICAAVDGACEELVGGTVADWRDLNFVQKVQKAHAPCMARLQAAAGLPEEEMKIVVLQSKRSIMGAAETLARFRREYSDAHGLSKAPAPLVQVAFDSAVYLLRVLAPRT